MTPTNPPTMTIDGVQYVEAPETDGCDGCAFDHRKDDCTPLSSMMRASFGGTCPNRRVIYIRAQPEQSEAASPYDAVPWPTVEAYPGGSDPYEWLDVWLGNDQELTRFVRAPRCPGKERGGSVRMLRAALERIASEAEDHPMFLSLDTTVERLEEIGGDAATITHWAQVARNALMPLPTTPTTDKEPRND